MRFSSAHPDGSFCWFELGTSDAMAADAFYGALLGWTVTHSPMGPNELYHEYFLNGLPVAASYTLNAQMRAEGVPPHWMPYIATHDVDASAARVTAAGGKVVGGPFEVMSNGRMAVVQDPTGAMISLWQAKSHHGISVYAEPGAVCWAELATRNVEAARAFYVAVAGWRPAASSTAGAAYTEWMVGDRPVGGMMGMDGPQWGEIPSHWLTYFMVSDCRMAAARVRELGGTTKVGPFDAPGVGTIAICSDPQGATFALITLAR